MWSLLLGGTQLSGMSFSLHGTTVRGIIFQDESGVRGRDTCICPRNINWKSSQSPTPSLVAELVAVEVQHPQLVESSQLRWDGSCKQKSKSVTKLEGNKQK